MKKEDVLIRLLKAGHISEDEFKLLYQVTLHTTVSGDDLRFLFDRPTTEK